MALGLITITSAWADPQTPGNSATQYGAAEIGKVVDLAPGNIDVNKTYSLSVKAGAGQSTSGGTVGSVKLDFDRRYFGYKTEGGYNSMYESASGIYPVLSPNLHLQVDYGQATSGGNEMKRLEIEALGFKPILLSTHKFGDTHKPGAIFENSGGMTFFIPSAQFVYSKNNYNATESLGAYLTVIEPNFKGAFKIDGRQVEICLNGRPGVVLGDNKIGQENASGAYAFRLDAHGCAYIDLGDIGSLGYDLNYRLTDVPNTAKGDAMAHTVEQSATLKNIAGTPVFVQASHTMDRSDYTAADGKGVTRGATTNMLHVGVAAY